MNIFDNKIPVIELSPQYLLLYSGDGRGKTNMWFVVQWIILHNMTFPINKSQKSMWMLKIWKKVHYLFVVDLTFDELWTQMRIMIKTKILQWFSQTVLVFHSFYDD